MDMGRTVSFDLPKVVEQKISPDTNVSDDARETYLVDLYRRGTLTHFELSQALGLDRFETDGVLKRHELMLELTAERFAEELADLRQLVRKRESSGGSDRGELR